MNDIQSWLHSSAAKARFFLHDLTRKPFPDVIAIMEIDGELAKGVILESVRPADVGALWWTIRDDVQKGLEMGYFDVSKVAPCLSPVSVAVPEMAQSASPVAA